MSELLQVTDLHVEAVSEQGRIPIVKGVSFSVRKGEVVALIGESGSGKTTIALSTMGYARPGCRISAGEVVLDGIDVLSLDREGLRRLRGRRVSYLAQSASATFNPALTIGEQVTESAILHGALSPAEARRWAAALYERLDLPDPGRIGKRFPHQVSGGQLQRLMAARAMCSRPELLLLDEPTTALDVTTQIEVLAAFNELIREQGTAAIYVTHDLALVAQIADRIVVVSDGEVRETGSVDRILHSPEDAYTRKLMAAIRRPPALASAPPSTTGEEEPGRNPLMAVSGVNAGFGDAMVLHDIDVEVAAGSVVGVIGESGCGKSTLARVIAGLLPARDGQIRLEGRSLPYRVEDRKKDQIQAIQIAFQMADVALNPRHRIREILGRPVSLFLDLHGEKRDQRVLELLDMVGLSRGLIDRYPGELSGGQKQRVNLARSLAAAPRLLLCDEVTSSLDTIVADSVIKLLKHLGEELDLAYVYISHDLSTIATLADHVVVLYAGHVVETGSTGQVLAPPLHPYTRLLLSSIPELRKGWLDDVMKTRAARSGLTGFLDRPATGCPFYNRCPLAIEGVCNTQPVPIRQPAGGHRIACQREIEELSASQEAPD